MKLKVEIVRFIHDDQPGWVESQFVDAEGKRHRFVDKIPGFTTARLGPQSHYPQPGGISCEILSHCRDEFGRALVRISTARPYDMESTGGVSEFIVLATQLSD